MILISVSTSRPQGLWPTEYWKTFFDALSTKGAKNDPRLQYPDLARALVDLVDDRGGRYFPKPETPFSEVDDCEVRMIRVVRVRPGSESVRFADGQLPDTTGWRLLEVPFFGTIGNSLYEAQSKSNASALLSVGGLVAEPVTLEVGFQLSLSRKDRDLDNLYDGLAPAFNRLFPSVHDLLLFKTEPWEKNTELLMHTYHAMSGVTPGRSTRASLRDEISRPTEPSKSGVSRGRITKMANTAAEAIREAMQALGGEAAIRDVSVWINENYPGRWKDISTAMADLTYPGSPSSTYPVSERFLGRVAPGRYRLREQAR